MGLTDASRKRLREGTSLGAGVLLVLLLVGIVNYFGWKYHARFDWTANRLYSLSEKSESVLRGLERDVEVVVLMDSGNELYDPVRELLSRYEAASPRVSVRLVDAQKSLLEAQQLVDRFELTRLDVVVFESAGERRIVDAADLADFDYSGMQFGQPAEMTGFKGEAAFTGALLGLSETHKPRILATSGHGERRLDDFSAAGLSGLADMLGQDNLEIEEWALLGQTEVPAETDLIVIAGPTSTFVAPELELLRSYLEGGGRLLALIDPTLDGERGLVRTGLEELLAEFGARVGDDLVVDPANPLPFFGAETIFVSSYGDHLVTRPLSQQQLPVIVQLGRSVGAGTADGFEVTELMRTSAEGWGETNLTQLDRVEQGDDDLGGPVPLGVAVELPAVPVEEPLAAEPELAVAEPAAEPQPAEPAGPPAVAGPAPELRLVVLGDSDLIANSQLQNRPNEILVGGIVNWLVERESLVAIPPKKPEQVRLSLTGAQMRGVTWSVLALLPGLALALGLVVYRQRRR